MQEELFILISTINERILNLKSILQPYNKKIRYIISHQVTCEMKNDGLNFIEILRKREDVRYSRLTEEGVAKNRNNTLKYIEPNIICLILDDDIALCKNTFELVLSPFLKNASADFVSFKILNEDHHDYKPYPKSAQEHTWKSLTGIGTTEMAFRSNMILEHNFSFDERFGPGAALYPSGEDYIFAMDLYKGGVKMYFEPIAIVSHPKESTGYIWSSKGFFAKGAVFSRVFGWKSYLIDFYFVFKHHKEYRNEYSSFSALKWMWKGNHHFLQGDKL